MKVCCFFLALVLAVLVPPAVASPGPGPQAASAALRTRLVEFFNRSLGWQGLTGITVLRLSPPGAHGGRTAVVELSKGAQHVRLTCSITRGGRYVVVNGERNLLSPDPWRGNREKLHVGQSPVEGPASAPVTIYEFSDLGCPPCVLASRRIQRLLRAKPGEARVVFKFYPVAEAHAWDVLAALAAACVTRHDMADFWPFEQAVFAFQGQLTDANVAQRLQGLALLSGTPGPYYRACIRSAGAQQAMRESLLEGVALRVQSTPTLFINGRRIVGAISYPTLQAVVAHEAQLAPLYDRPKPR